MSDPTAPAETASRTVAVGHADGLHLRPLTEIAKAAAAHPGPVRLKKGDATADAKAMIQAMTLAAGPGDEVTVEAEGDGAGAIVARIAGLISKG